MLEPSTIAAPRMIRRAVIMVSEVDHRPKSPQMQTFPPYYRSFYDSPAAGKIKLPLRAPVLLRRRFCHVRFL